MNKWYVVKFVTNTQGQDAEPNGVLYTTEEAALTNYHRELMNLHDASDVLYAIVTLQRGRDGSVQMSEIVDHKPAPQPEPEPEPELEPTTETTEE